VENEENLRAQIKIGLPLPLSKGQITIENDYITQTVYIRFDEGPDNYFDEYEIKGSCDHIASLSYYKDGSDGVIALKLDKVYELSEEYEKGSLYLDFISPHEIYDKVVVIDAGHGSRAPGAVKLGVAEKEIDLDILLQLKALFDECPENIGVYYTRTDGHQSDVGISGCSLQIKQRRICLLVFITIQTLRVILQKSVEHRYCTASRISRSCPAKSWRRYVWTMWWRPWAATTEVC